MRRKVGAKIKGRAVPEQSRKNHTQKGDIFGHAIKMDMDRISRIIRETTERTSGKMRNKWVVEISKDWTEMRIKVEGMKTGEISIYPFLQKG